MINLINCPECGGLLSISKGTGRFRKHRGEFYQLLTEFTFPICPGCNAEWLTDSQLDVLNDFFEKEYSRRIL